MCFSTMSLTFGSGLRAADTFLLEIGSAIKASVPLRQKAATTTLRLATALASIIIMGSGVPLAATEEWRSLGPEGGPINRIEIDRHNPNTIYATNFGVFKTTDGGNNWKAPNSGLISLPFGPVTAFAQDPQNSNTLYLGLGEGNSRMFKSIDGGTNWQALPSWPSGLSDWPYSLVVDPQDSGTVYAGICGGISKSRDGGATWVTTVVREWGCAQVVAIDPHDPSTLYIGLVAQNARGGALYKSADGGKTWTNLFPDSAWVSAVAIDPQDSSQVYVLAVPSREGYCFATCSWRLSRSSDGGASWVDADLPEGFGGGLVFDPQNPSAMYAAASGGTYRSGDGGRSWILVNANLTSRDARPLAVDPQYPEVLYMGGNRGDGILKSTDGGRSWITVNSGLTATQPSSLALDPQSSITIYAVIDGFVRRSTDGGSTWNAIDAPRISSFAFDPQDSARVYGLGYFPNRLFKSTDHGASWDTEGSSFQNSSMVNAIALDPQDPRTLYAASGDIDSCFYDLFCRGGVLKSSDGGNTWTNSPLPHPVTSVAVASQNSDTIYAGALGWLPQALGPPSQIILKSTDGGMKWTPILSTANGLSFGPLLAIDPSDPNIVYTYSPALFKSTNGGKTWIPANAGIAAEVRSLVIDPQNPSTLYAGTRGAGVFRSRDGGGTWTAVNSGLTSLTITSLALASQDPHTLYAGTFGGGLFSIAIDTP